MQLFSLGKTISIGIFIKIQWANFDELILFNCWLLNMFFPFSSVSNQTYLLRKNRYQLTVFDRLNSYNKVSYFFAIFPQLHSSVFLSAKSTIFSCNSLLAYRFIIPSAIFSGEHFGILYTCLLYTSPSPRD